MYLTLLDTVLPSFGKVRPLGLPSDYNASQEVIHVALVCKQTM